MDVTWRLAGSALVITTGDELRAKLLAARGVDDQVAESFFEPSYERDINDPQLVLGMDQAVERIVKAAAKGERVLVYGDYDADGVTGTAIMIRVLREFGIAATAYLPHRLKDGYGLNMAVLQRLKQDFDLLITVDCGISGEAEVAEMKAAGKDTIVVDHHTLPETLPPAIILHPGLGDYPYPDLSGAGMAWKFAQALLRDSRLGKGDGDQEKWLLDLCCIGTVADMVPLTGENRAIGYFGMEVLRRSRRPGVRMLVEAGQRGQDVVNSEVISFGMAPLLNAAGRMDHAQPALDLLLAETNEQAQVLMGTLRRLNEKRRSESRRVQTEAEDRLEIAGAAVFAYSEDWPAGVVGLVAGRLSEKFSRPSFVVGGAGAHAVGSVRAPAGYNVVEMLKSAESHLLTMGGHARAAGFSMAYDKVTAVREVLLKGDGSEVPVSEGRYADAVVGPDLLSWDTWEMMEKMRPFGEGNKRPVLIVRDVPLANWREVGKTGEHAKMDFLMGETMMDGIGFGLAKNDRLNSIKSGSLTDVLFQLDCNEYRGRKSLQLLVQDVAPAGTTNIENESNAVH